MTEHLDLEAVRARAREFSQRADDAGRLASLLLLVTDTLTAEREENARLRARLAEAGVALNRVSALLRLPNPDLQHIGQQAFAAHHRVGDALAATSPEEVKHALDAATAAKERAEQENARLRAALTTTQRCVNETLDGSETDLRIQASSAFGALTYLRNFTADVLDSVIESSPCGGWWSTHPGRRQAIGEAQQHAESHPECAAALAAAAPAETGEGGAG
jgi:hypothetical protein